MRRNLFPRKLWRDCLTSTEHHTNLFVCDWVSALLAQLRKFWPLGPSSTPCIQMSATQIWAMICLRGHDVQEWRMHFWEVSWDHLVSNLHSKHISRIAMNHTTSHYQQSQEPGSKWRPIIHDSIIALIVPTGESSTYKNINQTFESNHIDLFAWLALMLEYEHCIYAAGKPRYDRWRRSLLPFRPRSIKRTCRKTSWWFQPIWQILVKLDIFPK